LLFHYLDRDRNRQDLCDVGADPAGAVANRTVAAFKPVISGFDKREITNSDTGEILAALGEAPTKAAATRVSPWRFTPPLAPNMAARAEGRTLDCAALFAFSRKALQENADVVLIEGVGGIMVPLDDERTVLDWIVAAGAPVVLVVGDYLGTISHTLTAVEVLRAWVSRSRPLSSAKEKGQAFRLRRRSPKSRGGRRRCVSSACGGAKGTRPWRRCCDRGRRRRAVVNLNQCSPASERLRCSDSESGPRRLGLRGQGAWND